MNWFVPFLVLSTSLCAQDHRALTEYAFAKAEQLQQQETRPYFIFLHTDWCTYCRGMEQNTFTDAEIVALLNKQFYFVSFNAASTEQVHFANRSFNYLPTGTKTGMHELATALGSINGTVSFPTIVILNPNYEIELQVDGFINSAQLLPILRSYTD